ncbi:MAG: hypothetical protein IMZ62_14155 [Chloroflexi bacterium]|nr:hypothetical protein [Chloroflexota bacterium]
MGLITDNTTERLSELGVTQDNVYIVPSTAYATVQAAIDAAVAAGATLGRDYTVTTPASTSIAYVKGAGTSTLTIIANGRSWAFTLGASPGSPATRVIDVDNGGASLVACIEATAVLCDLVTASAVLDVVAVALVNDEDDLSTTEAGDEFTKTDIARVMTVADATYSRPVVFVESGVSPTYTPHPAVDVVFRDELIALCGRDGGSALAPEMPAEVFDLPYNGALIALRSDDGNKPWLNADNHVTWGTVSPALYAWRKGVPITHSVITSKLDLGGGTYLSWDELRKLLWHYACGIASHTVNHAALASSPTYEYMAEEICGSKRIIEDYPLTGLPAGTNNRLGVIVRYFASPGDWKPVAASFDAYVDSMAESNSWIGRLIRSTYQASGAITDTLGGASTQSRYWTRACAISAETLGDTKETALAALVKIAKPGARICFFGHNPKIADEHPYHEAIVWKNLIDAIADLRDDKYLAVPIYPRITLEPVTLDALALGSTRPPTFATEVKTSALQIQHSNLLYEDFADMGDGATTGTAWWSLEKGGESTAAIATNQLVLTGTASYVRLKIRANELQRGRQYKLRVRMQADVAVNVGFYSLGLGLVAGAGEDNELMPYGNVLYQVVGTAVMETHDFPFFIPTWSARGQTLYVMNGAAANDGKVLTIDSFEILPM